MKATESDYIGDDLAALGLRVEGGRVVLSDCLAPYRERIERTVLVYQNTCRKRAVPEGLSFWGVEKWARERFAFPEWANDTRAVLSVLDGLRLLVEPANGEQIKHRAADNPAHFTFGFRTLQDIRRSSRREMKARFGA